MVDVLQDAVARHAALTPSRVAAVCEHDSLTYGELDRLSTGIANMLVRSGCEPGDRVGLFIPRSPLAIVAMLGTYKAGCICVPMDVENPVPRLCRILQVCECKILLAASAGRMKLPQLMKESLVPVMLGWLEDTDYPGAQFSLVDVHVNANARDCAGILPPGDGVAQLLFTSGSTGTPKGVMVTHRSILSFVNWAVRHFDISTNDRVCGQTPLHFDLSMFDIFGALTAGAQLHLVPASLTLDAPRLAQWIRDTGITTWLAVPSLLVYLSRFGAVGVDDMPTLRHLMWCGEVLPTKTLIYFMTRLRKTTFTNLYGPTEACIASSHYTVSHCPVSAETSIPIGKPCPGEEILVLDEDCRRVKQGQTGELHIRGVGLSPGYWNDPARTAEVFIADVDGGGRLYKTGDLGYVADDGMIYFVGRKDDQIKSRGYRIELGEVEHALRTLEYIDESVVVALPGGSFGTTEMGCAYVPGEDRNQGRLPTRIRRDLLTMLPDYMAPTKWLELADLPRNRNGKIDRPAVKRMFRPEHARNDA